MKLKAYKTLFVTTLAPFYSDAQEVESFFYLITEKWHNISRVDLVLEPEFEIPSLYIEKWEEITDALKTQKPIQYLLGSTWFYGLEFLVTPATLIPRPETEELVDLILQEQTEFTNPKILDIGTGSGCIAISLAKNKPQAQVSALDFSTEALVTAIENAVLNNVDVTFTLQDILQTEALENFDVIVSNPPYVRDLEKAEIQKNVLDFEPHSALFVPNDNALLFYKKIAQLAIKSLSPNGFLYFEINQYLGAETKEMVEQMGFKNVKISKDVYGNNRMLRANKN
jgi:release factor glutamine methyltransferase